MPRSKGTTNQRGYGAAHRKERARWQRIIDTQGAPCARGCGRVIHAGMAWDLGHTDDRTTWTGPECVACNRAAGARKRNALARLRHPPEDTPQLRPSRRW